MPNATVALVLGRAAVLTEANNARDWARAPPEDFDLQAPCLIVPPEDGLFFAVVFEKGARFAADEASIYHEGRKVHRRHTAAAALASSALSDIAGMTHGVQKPRRSTLHLQLAASRALQQQGEKIGGAMGARRLRSRRRCSAAHPRRSRRRSSAPRLPASSAPPPSSRPPELSRRPRRRTAAARVRSTTRRSS